MLGIVAHLGEGAAFGAEEGVLHRDALSRFLPGTNCSLETEICRERERIVYVFAKVIERNDPGRLDHALRSFRGSDNDGMDSASFGMAMLANSREGFRQMAELGADVERKTYINSQYLTNQAIGPIVNRAYGIDLSATNTKLPPLIIAIILSQDYFFERLLEMKASLLTTDDKGNTGFHYLAAFGRSSFLEIAVGHGQSGTNMRNQAGLTVADIEQAKILAVGGESFVGSDKGGGSDTHQLAILVDGS